MWESESGTRAYSLQSVPLGPHPEENTCASEHWYIYIYIHVPSRGYRDKVYTPPLPSDHNIMPLDGTLSYLAVAAAMLWAIVKVTRILLSNSVLNNLPGPENHSWIRGTIHQDIQPMSVIPIFTRQRRAYVWPPRLGLPWRTWWEVRSCYQAFRPSWREFNVAIEMLLLKLTRLTNSRKRFCTSLIQKHYIISW